MRPFDPEALTERIVRALAGGAEMTSLQIAAALAYDNPSRVASTLAWLEDTRRAERCGIDTWTRRGQRLVIWRSPTSNLQQVQEPSAA